MKMRMSSCTFLLATLVACVAPNDDRGGDEPSPGAADETGETDDVAPPAALSPPEPQDFNCLLVYRCPDPVRNFNSRIGGAPSPQKQLAACEAFCPVECEVHGPFC